MNKKLLTCLSILSATAFIGACSEELQEMPKILVNHSEALVTKESGEKAVFSATLSQNPKREVVLSIESSDLTEGVVEPSELILNESNWFVPVSFTITGVQDGIVDGDVQYKIKISEKSGTAVLNQLEAVQLDAKNMDIDEKVVVEPDSELFKLSSTTLLTKEGGPAAEFSLALGSKPTAAVAVTIGVSDDSEGALSLSKLSFSEDNWQQAQVVKVNPLTDDVVDGDQDYLIEFSVSSTDERYQAYKIAPIDVKNIDVDEAPTATLKIRAVSGNITSGNDQSYDEGHGLRIFQALKPDIAMVQEFNMEFSSLSAMVADTFGPEFHYTVGDGSIPNGVVSRFPILEHGAWKSNITTNRDWDWAVIDIPGKKELLVVSVHLNTGDHDKEFQPLKERIQSKVAEGDFYVLLGGDFNTKNRGKAESVLLSIVDAKQPYPVDQNGVDGTNSGRTKPYDWVLCSHDWAKFEVPVVIGSHSYPNGHVFDSRVYEQNGELSDVPPVLSGDSASDNMQHMAVVRDFVFHTK